MSGDRLAAALLTAVSAGVTSAIVLAMALGGLTPTLASFALLASLLGAGFTFWKTQETRSIRPGAWDVLLFSLFALASLRAFLWLIYAVGDEWRVLSPYNLGDISLHIQFIRYLASGVDFWPASPILTGVPLSYPLGADLWNSLLLLHGLPLERGLIWTGLAGAALAAWALWRWGGAFAMAAFLFNGGLAGFAILHTGQAQDFESELAWKNVFLTMLVTQRGLLYALPCGLMLLRAWRDDFFRDGSGLPRSVQFFLYTTMPVFSVHAFLFLSLTLAAVFLFQTKSRFPLAVFVFLAVVPASTAMWFVTGGFSAASGLRWLPGWMQADGGWKFWVVNFGISLPLLIWLVWKGIVRGNIESRAFCTASIGVFILCFLVAFAPWEWDNTKLLIWAWLVAAPFLWTRILEPLKPIARASLCVALFFSGAVSLMAGLDGRHGYELAKKSELAATAQALRDVPAGSRIAVEPRFNNPVILLGYPVVCGYEGHLWSHGLPYREPLAKLQSVLRQDAGWRNVASKLGAGWVYLPSAIPVLQRVDADQPEP
ncbi:MAG: hypothetical protein WCG66_09090 [bacterium]